VKKLLLAVISYSLLIFSCDLYNIDTTGGPGNFWAYNFILNQQYRLHAELMVEGEYCNIWVERGCGINRAAAQVIAEEYDNNIRSIMIENFSLRNFTYLDIEYSDILKLADEALGNGDGKLCILILDIKDDYETGVNESYIAGYFLSGDLLNRSNTNRRDMIYIDANPGMTDLTDEKLEAVYKTLVHEIQHLVNYSTSMVVRGGTPMDTWIDEGLSAAAEYVYSGHSLGRVNWFRYNGTEPSDVRNLRGVIDQGNNFFVWNNRVGTNSGQSSYAVLDDYATVYLFFQWLRLQHDEGQRVYYEIITSIYRDFRAVTASFGNMAWSDLLEAWLKANYINDSQGFYGYNGDEELSNVRVPAPLENGINETVLLSAGEGVYSMVTGTPPNLEPYNNIVYVLLQKAGEPNQILLTYNKSTSRSSLPESGITTGIPIPQPPIVNMFPAGRSSVPYNYAPFPIGARDLIEGNYNNE